MSEISSKKKKENNGRTNIIIIWVRIMVCIPIGGYYGTIVIVVIRFRLISRLDKIRFVRNKIILRFVILCE